RQRLDETAEHNEFQQSQGALVVIGKRVVVRKTTELRVIGEDGRDIAGDQEPLASTTFLHGEIAIAVSLAERGYFLPWHTQADIAGRRPAHHAPFPPSRSVAAGFSSSPAGCVCRDAVAQEGHSL